MSDIAIRLENLGKRYYVGVQQERYRTLRDTIVNTVTTPYRTVRTKLQRMGAGQSNGDNSFWALKDISFEVKHGEVIGIIGHNGAGKSTMLKILSRITEPTEGYADMYGRVASLLEVGTGFHAELTGRENIFLNGAILGMRKTEIQRKFDEIVAFSEVEKFIDTPVKHYSSGMGLRLAFAVAAHLEPEILVVDEVLAVGDASFQRKCMGKMRDVAGEGRTILFVSHNMAAIQALCQRALLLQQGKVVFSGDAQVVVDHYLNHEISSMSEGMLDLSMHPNRVTDKALFKSIRMINSEGTETSLFKMGEQIAFDIDIDAGDRVLNNPAISIEIERRSMSICRLSTRFMFKDSFSLTGRTKIRCYWNPGWLSPGTYSISKLNLKSYQKGERLDGIQDVLPFEITAVDVYGTGKSYPEGMVLIPDGSWDIPSAAMSSL